MLLVVEGVEKFFGEFMAVIEANLTINKGEITAIIGPNGAGKTTLLNMITGHLKNDAGKIIFNGEDIAGLPPYAICNKGIARSFQLINLFPRLTVFENVQVAVLSYLKKSSYVFGFAQNLAVEETMNILDSVGLGNKSTDIAALLSRSDQKILDIAIALASKPELLILDEPTGGMSSKETSTTIKLIKMLAKTQGLTILFCEHNMEIVFSIANSIMVMNQGRTIVQNSPKAVLKNRDFKDYYQVNNNAGNE
jgi:branched-chain amino acid transport system ATP-binding protein